MAVMSASALFNGFLGLDRLAVSGMKAFDFAQCDKAPFLASVLVEPEVKLDTVA